MFADIAKTFTRSPRSSTNSDSKYFELDEIIFFKTYVTGQNWIEMQDLGYLKRRSKYYHS